jgi:Fe2+ transport system protein B
MIKKVIGVIIIFLLALIALSSCTSMRKSVKKTENKTVTDSTVENKTSSLTDSKIDSTNVKNVSEIAFIDSEDSSITITKTETFDTSGRLLKRSEVVKRVRKKENKRTEKLSIDSTSKKADVKQVIDNHNTAQLKKKTVESSIDKDVVKVKFLTGIPLLLLFLIMCYFIHKKIKGSRILNR